MKLISTATARLQRPPLTPRVHSAEVGSLQKRRILENPQFRRPDWLGHLGRCPNEIFISAGQDSTTLTRLATRHQRSVIFWYAVESRYHPSQTSSGIPQATIRLQLHRNQRPFQIANWPTSTNMGDRTTNIATSGHIQHPPLWFCYSILFMTCVFASPTMDWDGDVGGGWKFYEEASGK